MCIESTEYIFCSNVKSLEPPSIVGVVLLHLSVLYQIYCQCSLTALPPLPDKCLVC